ncbi:MAG: hypothetical protein CMG74_12770 [Candidatus Marinimicrobia bacterium]|nr:hypothetical protein [Candidatus Neomarinimicrobiota bacterium]|tara:strand:+ start:886 stop:1479 length:594 start_codon:yes stop_codon:yes gene_type:complete
MNKRIFDLVFSILGVILLLPIIIFISILIKSDSKGPIFFKQDRVGKDEKVFKTYKFRTMKIQKENVHPLTIKNDPRITKIGYSLRKLKIDELPQLFNVIKGEMSLVGPRPETLELIKFWPNDKKSIVLSIRPGMTDNASIEYLNESDYFKNKEDSLKTFKDDILPKKLDLYVDYVNQRTLINDFYIIFLTFLRIVKQ